MYINWYQSWLNIFIDYIFRRKDIDVFSRCRFGSEWFPDFLLFFTRIFSHPIGEILSSTGVPTKSQDPGRLRLMISSLWGRMEGYCIGYRSHLVWRSTSPGRLSWNNPETSSVGFQSVYRYNLYGGTYLETETSLQPANHLIWSII